MTVATRDLWKLAIAGARAIDAFLPACAHAKAPRARHHLPGLRYEPNGLVCTPLRSRGAQWPAAFVVWSLRASL
jgi:hypothetical protein